MSGFMLNDREEGKRQGRRPFEPANGYRLNCRTYSEIVAKASKPSGDSECFCRHVLYGFGAELDLAVP